MLAAMRFSKFMLLVPLVLLTVTGMLSPFKYNLLPTTGVFEVVFVLGSMGVFLFTFRGVNKVSLYFFLLSLAYMAYGYLQFHSGEGEVRDFMQAYKAFFYVCLLSFFVRSEVLKSEEFSGLFYFLLFLFFVKYFYSRLFGFDDLLSRRPGIFTENNFELVLLLIFYCALHPVMLRVRIYSFFVLSVIVILSESRSALLGLFCVYLLLFVYKINYRLLFTIIFLFLLSIVIGYIFIKRMEGGLESVDRYLFLTVFLSETAGWGWREYFFGSQPLTPLSNEACSILSYYIALFSFSGDGTCYSVVLHSFILRVIFDHGVLGLVFLLSFVFWALTRSDLSRRQTLAILAVILSSSLSVSALNSVYVALALAIVLSTNMRRIPVLYHSRWVDSA